MRKELAEDPRGVFAAPSREVALGLASESATRWRGSHPGVAENLEELFEECLPGVSPHPHHKRPRTSQLRTHHAARGSTTLKTAACMTNR
jgi:hypothetical protein